MPIFADNHLRSKRILAYAGLCGGLLFPLAATAAYNKGTDIDGDNSGEGRHVRATLRERLTELAPSLIIAGGAIASATIIAGAYLLSKRRQFLQLQSPSSGVFTLELDASIDELGGNPQARQELRVISNQWRLLIGGQEMTGCPRRILIEAPEGSGKSLAAEALINNAAFRHCVVVHGADLARPRGNKSSIDIIYEALQKTRQLRDAHQNELGTNSKPFAVLLIEGVEHFGFDSVSEQLSPEYRPLRDLLAHLQALFTERSEETKGILLVCTANSARPLDQDLTTLFEHRVSIYSSNTQNQRLDLINAMIKGLQSQWKKSSVDYKVVYPEMQALQTLATLVDGMSGEEVKRVLLRAADRAYNRFNGEGDVVVELNDLIEGFADVRLGLKTGDEYSPEQIKAMKCHELGHVVLFKALGIPMPYFSTVPRGDGAARVLRDLSSKVLWPSSKRDLLSVAFSLAAGMAAERAFIGHLDTTRGATRDLEDIYGIGKILAEHGFIGDSVYPQASKLSFAQYPDLRRLVGKFATEVISITERILKDSFTEQEFDQMVQYVPDIDAEAEHFYGDTMKRFLEAVLPDDKLERLKSNIDRQLQDFPNQS